MQAEKAVVPRLTRASLSRAHNCMLRQSSPAPQLKRPFSFSRSGVAALQRRIERGEISRRGLLL